MSTTLPTRAFAIGLAGAGCATIENWTRRTRATSEGKHKPLPGDGLVAKPMWQATRATTVHAPRAAVWPWLVRLMMRARISYAPVAPALLVRLLIVAGFGIGDTVQAGAMLAGIKARAESRAGNCRSAS
jgi:hypothetical protein